MKVVIMSLLLLTTGCGLFTSQPDPAKVITQANAWQIELNGLIRQLRPFAVAVDAICDHRALNSRECLMASTAWDAAKKAAEAANLAIQLYRTGAYALDKVDDALELAQKAAERVEATVIAIQEATNGLGMAGRDVGSGGASGAGSEQGTGGAASGGSAGGASGVVGPGTDAPQGGSAP